MSYIALRATLLRPLRQSKNLRLLPSTNTRLPASSNSVRSYAKKSKHTSQDLEDAPGKKTKVSAAEIIPGSQQILTDPTQAAEYEKCSSKMAQAVDWFRRETAQMETRASGRVTPQLLSPVRVKYGGEGSEAVRLEEVATVGVRDGTTLVVTVFETDVSVFSGLYIL